jgi:dCTP deaminase
VILSDRDLACLHPNPGPASVDLHLGHELLTLRSGTVLDPERDQADEWEPCPVASDGRWRLDRLHPYLSVTKQKISVSRRHVGLLHGISSLGRLFLLIHVTAGLVDPGWTESPLTLELMALGAPILLRPGMRIGQITLHELTSDCRHPYAGKYLHDQGAVPSRMHLEAR